MKMYYGILRSRVILWKLWIHMISKYERRGKQVPTVMHRQLQQHLFCLQSTYKWSTTLNIWVTNKASHYFHRTGSQEGWVVENDSSCVNTVVTRYSTDWMFPQVLLNMLFLDKKLHQASTVCVLKCCSEECRGHLQSHLFLTAIFRFSQMIFAKIA